MAPDPTRHRRLIEASATAVALVRASAIDDWDGAEVLLEALDRQALCDVLAALTGFCVGFMEAEEDAGGETVDELCDRLRVAADKLQERP